MHELVKPAGLQRRQFLRLLGGSALIVSAGGVLAGCGGGVVGQGNKPPDGGSTGGGPTGGGGTPGGGTPGTPVTPAQRAAAMDAVHAQAKSVWSNDMAETNRKVLAYLKTRPEFWRVGISDDGTVWGRFTDGAMYRFIDNIRPDTTGGAPQAMSRTRAANSDVPRSSNIQVLNGFGDYLPNPTANLRGWLLANGYTESLSSAREATLEALRNIRGTGVLYLATHGGDGDGGFCLTSATRVVDARENDPTVKQEIKDGLLTYCSVVLDNPGLFGDPEFARVYGFTYKFIEKYWSFAQNSLVYIDACSSEEILLKEKCFAKGASLYAGWTAPVAAGVLNRAARFSFDRMLGANKAEPKEDPDQRPFDYAAVWDDLKARGYDTSPGGAYGTAKLIFSLNGVNPDYGLLAPSIKFLDVDEFNDELILHGLFGQRKGIVRIGTTDLTVKTWEKEKVVCVLPRTGSGSAGPVTAIVAGHKSNVRYLTEWRGQFRYTLKAIGTLTQAFTFNVHFRADVGSYREKPHEAPKDRSIQAFGSRLCAGTYACSGQHEETDRNAQTYTETWTGSGALPYFPDSPDMLNFMGFDTIIDPKNRKMLATITGMASEGNRFRFLHRYRADVIQDVSHDTVAGTRYHTIGSVPNPMDQDIPVTFDSGFNIVAGNWEKTISWFNYHEFSSKECRVRVEWNAIRANHPPDPEGARSV